MSFSSPMALSSCLLFSAAPLCCPLASSHRGSMTTQTWIFHYSWSGEDKIHFLVCYQWLLPQGLTGFFNLPFSTLFSIYIDSFPYIILYYSEIYCVIERGEVYGQTLHSCTDVWPSAAKHIHAGREEDWAMQTVAAVPCACLANFEMPCDISVGKSGHIQLNSCWQMNNAPGLLPTQTCAAYCSPPPLLFFQLAPIFPRLHKVTTEAAPWRLLTQFWFQ